MCTSRPGESWMTSRELPSVRSWVRLAMSALGVMLPIRFGASVGSEAAVGALPLAPPPAASCVPADDRSAQRAGSIRRGASSPRPPGRPWAAGAGDQAPTAAGGDCGSCGRRLGQRLAAIGAELRAGFVLPAAKLASARGHKVRWPNLLLKASLRHMRALRATLVALLVVATGCATSRIPLSQPTAREPLHITIVYP